MGLKFVLRLAPLGLLLIFISCQNEPVTTSEDFYKSQLFKEVQLSEIFTDSKTFVDCIPKHNIDEIIKAYDNQHEKDFGLKRFVTDNFDLPITSTPDFVSETSQSMLDHVVELWPVLTQKPDAHHINSSLIPLPYPYIVPGGRFREIYYWDSYFTQLGLMASGEEEMTQNMVNNFSFLIDSLGFIPNGNRDYFLGRSQPPFFSLMVRLIASNNRDEFINYQQSMVDEYHFWMKGADDLSLEHRAEARVVLMPDSSILNRYWDNYAVPRPESFKADYQLVNQNNLSPKATYRHLRAGAESGWDFSSRWFKDNKNISTIHTTDIIPVDLNSLMYHLEVMIAQGYNWNGEVAKSKEYLIKADNRKKAILNYLWDDKSNFFIDYDYLAQEPTGVLSLAGVYPLYFKLASKSQAKAVSRKIVDSFLKPGGFVSTLNTTEQQWDAPNGWAPLQWMTINGLYNYGYFEIGNSGAERWLARNKEVYKATGKMMDKYNVVDTGSMAGGGEYDLQDGFGWTNGVALALDKILKDEQKIRSMTIKSNH